MTPISRTSRTAVRGVRRIGLRRRGVGLFLCAAACASAVAASAPARAQNAFCDDLRAQIASAGQSAEAARYRAAAGQQQSEINRTIAYARSIGCESRQFLFFGKPPPPQCGQIGARIGQMRANLASLDKGAGEDQRQALSARYDAQCRERRIVQARRPRNFLEEMFGTIAPDEGSWPWEGPGEQPSDPLLAPLEGEDGRPQGGSMAICVRACDGGFFPVSYAARRGNLAELADLCKALCPNAETTLYTRSPYRDVNTAVSIDGAPYADHPNALKFQKTFDPTCACKAPDKTWVETLADAERMVAAAHGDDIVVTEEKAAELSRPPPPGEPRVRLRGAKDAAGAVDGKVDGKPPAPPAAPTLAPAEPIGSAKNGEEPSVAGAGQGVTREVVGPDGVKRRVRIIAPTL
ncbi:MAG: DUF2865 domain-containing protein [Methylocystis sp.]|nr:DUF2865 domain-containing protein [Methylocystis sp.]